MVAVLSGLLLLAWASATVADSAVAAGPECVPNPIRFDEIKRTVVFEPKEGFLLSDAFDMDVEEMKRVPSTTPHGRCLRQAFTSKMPDDTEFRAAFQEAACAGANPITVVFNVSEVQGVTSFVRGDQFGENQSAGGIYVAPGEDCGESFRKQAIVAMQELAAKVKSRPTRPPTEEDITDVFQQLLSPQVPAGDPSLPDTGCP